MNIKLITEINSFKNSKLYLPNSVSVLKDNSVVVSDGGNDRICDRSNSLIKIYKIID